VQSLYLHIEHRLGVNLDAKGSLNVVSQPLLVRLLDSGPLLLEFWIVGVFQKALEFLKVLEPFGFGDLESLGDEVGKTGITLINPAAGSHWDHTSGARDIVIGKIFTSVGNVSKFADSIIFDKVLANRGPQELGMEFSDTVDLARACNS